MTSVFDLLLDVIFLVCLSTRCESQGYCHFPSYIWSSIRNDDDGRSDPDTPYRKWYSRTEYVRNTNTWARQKVIEGHQTEIVIHHRLYASCSGYDVSGMVPCYRQTKSTRFICVAQEPEGKFRVQHLSEDGPATFTCLRFEKRSDYIVQVYFAVRNVINVDKLCYDVALQRDEWPWIDIDAPIVPCPFIGGFDFRAYTGDSRVEQCETEWRSSRLESECLPGEGVKFIFPSPDCSFLNKAAIEQTMLCRGSWVEENFHFIVMSDVSGAPRYVMRLPVKMEDSAVAPPVFAMLYFSLVVPASGRGQPPGSVLYEELRLYRSEAGLCHDESPECRKRALEGQCRETPIYQFANHCKRSCGLCDFAPSDKPECQFSERYQGNWTLITANSLETITIDGGTVQSTTLGAYVCKSKHWDLEYYKVLSIFQNGCRARYSCFQLQHIGSNMMEFRISNSSSEDRSFDMCTFDDETPPWQSPLLDHDMKTLFNKEHLHLDFCGLGGIFHTNVTFADGRHCEGTISDVDQVTCRLHQQLQLKFYSCHSVDVQNFICVAFTQHRQGTGFLVTEALVSQTGDKYQCWIVKQPDIGRTRSKQTKIWRLKRAKCTRAEIYQPTQASTDILTIETFSDYVETQCDIYHGAMERLFQGASSASSSPATNNMADDDTWKSYDKYKSRDSDMKQNGAGAVKRFSTSNSDVLSYSPGLCIFVILSHLYATTLLSVVFDRRFDVHLT